MLFSALALGKTVEELADAAARQMAAQCAASVETRARESVSGPAAKMVVTDRVRLRYSKVPLPLGAEPIRLLPGGSAAGAVK